MLERSFCSSSLYVYVWFNSIEFNRVSSAFLNALVGEILENNAHAYA